MPSRPGAADEARPYRDDTLAHVAPYGNLADAILADIAEFGGGFDDFEPLERDHYRPLPDFRDWDMADGDE
ncbi:MAG: hypothetical protein WDM91_13115 [Rhizomicrobium sp.]